MEALGLVGAAASIGQLLDMSSKASSTTWSLVRSFIQAPEELTKLTQELDRLKLMIDQLARLQEESSIIPLDHLFPAAHRRLVHDCLRANAESLNCLKSLRLCQSPDSGKYHKRILWTAVDKCRAKAILMDVKDAENTLDVALSVMTV